MGQALYRKYRSRSLDEIIGQEHITRTLKQALKQGRISHAYLFTGPRGVGKTSVARILAHAINDLPYKGDDSHLDIIEIDAASNRRIDEIRELRDKVYVAPASAKYKVYIIDEVHMLTREAFNALLKTLEEPPAHAVFILATTDAHKLPETIVSRTQRFAFKPVETTLVVKHLQDIAKTEGIKISDEAARLLAEHGEGSFRDSISLLDQAGNHADKIELADIQRLLGVAPASAIEDLLASAVSSAISAADVMRAITDLYGQGYQAASIAKQLGQAVRQRLLAGELDPDTVFHLLRDLIEVPAAHDPERFLEIALLRAAPRGNVSPPQASVKATDKPAPKQPKPDLESSAEEPPKLKPAEPKESIKPTKKSKNTPQQALDSSIWPEVLEAVKRHHNTLYSIVRMADPDFSEAGTVKLTFAFAFHQKRIDENANRQKIADIIENLTGQTVKVEPAHDKNAKPPVIAEPPAEDTTDPNLSAISNIFGNAELLES